MREPIRYESTQEPADDEERELMDPESWDWESAELLPGGGRVLYEVSPQFSPEEYRALAAFAGRQGTDPTEAARRIILDRLTAESQPRDVAGIGRRQSA